MSDVNFTPTRGAYKELTPFRYWCQKVLPLVYDDSISYYELLCKVVNYLNITMEDVSTLNDDVTAMYTAYNELQDFVNQYFTDLNVQTQIDNKLDRMAADGSLNALIDPVVQQTTITSVAGALPDVVEDQLPAVVDDQIDNVVGEQIDGVVAEQIQGAANNWLSANITGSNALDSTLKLYDAAARSFSAGNIIDTYAKYLGAENRITTFAAGFWENDNGTMVRPSDANLFYQSAAVNVVPGDKYTIIAPAFTDVYNDVPRYAFTDNNYSVVSTSDAAERGAINKTITVPAGATKLIVNDNLVEYVTDSRISKMILVKGELTGTNEIADLKADLNKIAIVYNNIVEGKTFINRYTAPNGQGANSDSWRQFMIPVTAGDKYSLSASVSGGRLMTCYYNGTDQTANVVTGGLDSTRNRVETVPNTATLLKISFQYTDIDTVAVVKSGVVVTIDQIENVFPAPTFSVYSKSEIDLRLVDAPEIVYLSASPSNYRQVLESITDSSYNKRYVVMLSSGTYDIWNMLTAEEQANTNFQGLWTPPFTKLVGIEKDVVISCNAPSLRNKLSPVNLDVTASIEYCKVTANNCRYAIHDDWQTRKWYNNASLPDYWTDAFRKGFVRVCQNVETEITNSAVGASWGCGTVNATNWIYRNCKIGKGGSTYGYICHNDNASMRGANVTLENCRVGGAIRFSSLNAGQRAECYAHLIGTSASGVSLTEESVSAYGAGIRWHVDGYANTFNNVDVTIVNTDGEDYSGNVDLIG